MRDGTWTNWDLIFKIATEITEEEWDAGPQLVAERIAEIEAEYLSDHTKLQETIELNPATGLFRVTPAAVENPALTSALLSRIEDCLDDVLSGNNGLTSTSREVRTLKRTIEKCANDPQRIELDLTSVSVSLRRQIYETGELATSKDNLALLESTEKGARGIRTNNPEIAENRNRLLSDEARQSLTAIT